MAHMTVTIDGNTVMDSPLGDWTANPPEILTEQLAATTTPKLYMRCLLILMADAALSDTATTVDITTDADNWTMRVQR